MTEQIQPNIQEQVQYIKLIKNTRGYNWEIKILDKTNSMSVVLETIEQLNNLMLVKFPTELKS